MRLLKCTYVRHVIDALQMHRTTPDLQRNFYTTVWMFKIAAHVRHFAQMAIILRYCARGWGIVCSRRLKLFITLCIVQRPTFLRYKLFKIIFYFIFNCILFYDYCVLPLRVHGCAWQLLIKKSDDDDDDDVINQVAKTHQQQCRIWKIFPLRGERKGATRKGERTGYHYSRTTDLRTIGQWM